MDDLKKAAKHKNSGEHQTWRYGGKEGKKDRSDAANNEDEPKG
jgi:hypothetical protein